MSIYKEDNIMIDHYFKAETDGTLTITLRDDPSRKLIWIFDTERSYPAGSIVKQNETGEDGVRVFSIKPSDTYSLSKVRLVLARPWLEDAPAEMLTITGVKGNDGRVTYSADHKVFTFIAPPDTGDLSV